MEILIVGYFGVAKRRRVLLGANRWFHGTFLSAMDDGRADLSRSGFSVRVEGGSGTVAGWDVIERKVEEGGDFVGNCHGSPRRVLPGWMKIGCILTGSRSWK